MVTGESVLVVGGSPEPSSIELVRELAEMSSHVVAVDRGLDVLIDAGVTCDLFCGDIDSLSGRGLEVLRACEASDGGPVREIESYNPHKDDTDLALALRAIERRWPRCDLMCTCLMGGRPDHALAVYGRLVDSTACRIRIRENGMEAQIMREGASETYRKHVGSRFSFVPLSMYAVVSEQGMRWNLDRARVPLLSDLGISNVIEKERATCVCHRGIIAAWCFDA